MVVHDLHIAWACLAPYEANAPLIVYPNAVLSRSIALQGLQPIAWRNAKVGQNTSLVEHAQLSQGDGLNVRGKPPAPPPRPYQFRFRIGEASDHSRV
jgi:hypothetical protein